MASYRDRQNPEILHFPGKWSTKLLISIGLVILAFCAAASIFDFQGLSQALFDASIIITAALFLLACWPTELTLDPGGIRRNKALRVGTVQLPWKEIASAKPGRELGGEWAAAIGLRTDTLVLRGASLPLRIVHTPRHTDRARLLLELSQHGVPAPRSPESGQHEKIPSEVR